MKRQVGLSAAVLMAACVFSSPVRAQELAIGALHRPDGKGDRTRQLPPRGDAGTAGTTGNGINYTGGPVMLGTTKMYYIWYGAWSSSDQAILQDFATYIGGSPYYNINTTYFDGGGNNVANAVTFAGTTADNYSQGTSLSDASIQTIVSNALKAGALPTDPNGVYFVLTSADVNETSGFCTQYCGWHTYGFLNNANIKYSFVGNAARCPSACAAQTIGPNGTTGPDAMVSVIAHELEEAATDPNLNAWFDSAGYENADKCAWTFGTTYITSNGAHANMKLGSRDFLIQQNWVNASGGYCALSYASVPDFSLSVSPGSQSVVQGGTTAAYGITITPSNGFADTVNFSTSGLPAGATPQFVSTSSTTANLTIATASTLAAGTYPFTIIGTASAGSPSHSVGATVVITPSGDFAISVAPTSLTVARGSSGQYAVTVTPSGTFSSKVQLSVSGLPSNSTGSFAPNPVTGGKGTSTLTIATSSKTSRATRTITVTGTSGSLVHSQKVTLVVK